MHGRRLPRFAIDLSSSRLVALGVVGSIYEIAAFSLKHKHNLSTDHGLAPFLENADSIQRIPRPQSHFHGIGAPERHLARSNPLLLLASNFTAFPNRQAMSSKPDIKQGKCHEKNNPQSFHDTNSNEGLFIGLAQTPSSSTRRADQGTFLWRGKNNKRLETKKQI